MDKKYINPVFVSGYQSDLVELKTVHCTVTLSATPGTVFNAEIPAWADYVKIYPATSDVYFALNQNPVAGTTITGSASVNVSGMYAGDVAIGGMWETRVIDRGAGHILLCSASASASVTLVFVGGM
jgi:hypothetical protein